jgi:hypothetical protein
MRILSFLAASAAILCAQPQRTSPLVIENEHVRVLKVVDVPHRKGQLHEHAMNRVMIYLNPGHIMIRYEDGKIDDQQFKAGEVRWSKAGGRHTSENAGDNNVEIVEVELKSKAGGESKPITAPLDPVKLHPAQYKTLFENDQVRVVRVRLDPKMKVKQHEHTVNRVQVFLSDFSVRVTTPDGKVSEISRKAGETAFAGPAKHEEENLLATAGELVLVELKR